MKLNLPAHLSTLEIENRKSYEDIAWKLVNRLFPICRSITGNGVRETLKIISEHVPLNIFEIPSGTKIYDWEVPKEWNVNDAFIKNSSGKKIVDFKNSNLHLLNYSIPFQGTLSLDQLKPHLYSLPDLPNAIPYLTTYYKEDWGFCLAHNELINLKEDSYQVVIDSTLAPGSLTIGEYYLPPTEPYQDATNNEILLSTYCCHPSMANNELSGPTVAVLLYNYLSRIPSRSLGYRFVFSTETIGTLAYLQMRGSHLKESLRAGFVLTCCGDRGAFTYKKTRNSNTLNKLVEHCLKHLGVPHKILDFFPTGSDERQYSSPGFNLPVGSLMRSMYTQYPEYHTSLDNLEFISADSLVDTFLVYLSILHGLENNHRFTNLSPFGEPQLGKRGLISTTGGQKGSSNLHKDILYLLNYSDNKHDLLDIAAIANRPLWEMIYGAEILCKANLLKKISGGS